MSWVKQSHCEFWNSLSTSYQLGLWPGRKLSSDQSQSSGDPIISFQSRVRPLSSSGSQWLHQHLPLSGTHWGAPNSQACDAERIVTDNKNIPPSHTSTGLEAQPFPLGNSGGFDVSISLIPRGIFDRCLCTHRFYLGVCELIMVRMPLPQVHCYNYCEP